MSGTSEPMAPEAEPDAAAEREVYYEAARSWAHDRDTALVNSRRTAWIVASVATGIAALEALALVAMLPLKTVVPYTVMVDKATGYSTVLDGTHPQVLKPQSALTQSMLAQYVVARETFDIGTIAEQYRKVGLWSEGEARSDYLALMPITNAQSPMNVFPRSAVVTVTVDSVALVGPDTAQVRFVTDRRDNPTAASVRTAYVAQIRYRFAGEPMVMDDRLVNPLGFEVSHYRRDQEALPAAGAPPTNVAPAVTTTPSTTVPPAAGTFTPRPVPMATQPAPPEARPSVFPNVR